jgi:hypothetical protein
VHHIWITQIYVFVSHVLYLMGASLADILAQGCW